MFSRSKGVERRLAHFLAAFTAPQWVDQTIEPQTPGDATRGAKVLDLVLEILLNANLGLAIVRRPDGQPEHGPTVRRLHAPQTGARFEVRIGPHGGYDLRVLTAGEGFVGTAMTFEALTMALRTFAALNPIGGRSKAPGHEINSGGDAHPVER